MKILRHAAVSALALFSLAATGAQSSTATSESFMNTYQGSLSIGGSLSISKTGGDFGADKTTRFDLNPGVEYFLVDRFSLGGFINLYNLQDGDVVALLGPSATFHFLQIDRVSLFSDAKVGIGLNDNTVDTRLGFGIGANYFVTQSVGLGPRAYYYRQTYSGFKQDNVGLSFGLWVYI